MHNFFKMAIPSKAILALTKPYIGAFTSIGALTSKPYFGASVEVGGGRRLLTLRLLTWSKSIFYVHKKILLLQVNNLIYLKPVLLKSTQQKLQLKLFSS